jgi:hypothetical protein
MSQWDNSEKGGLEAIFSSLSSREFAEKHNLDAVLGVGTGATNATGRRILTSFLGGEFLPPPHQ